MTTPLPDISESWIDPILDAVISDIQMSGYFDKIQTHEPKSAPGYGLTAAVWFLSLSPVPSGSGLDKTSARLALTVRLFSNMLMEPQDLIDPNLMRAASNLIRRWHDNFDFDLDPMVRNVDCLGAYGEALSAISGYVEHEQGKIYRIIDITVPIIINDVWPQVP
jgi:hypothetical protein